MVSTIPVSESDQFKKRFSELTTRQDVADLLEVDIKLLYYYLYRVPNSKRYATYDIPKKSGGVRTISAPATPLKIVQTKLNQVLQAVYIRRPPVYGFVPNKNIIFNARQHSCKRYVFNIDLKDFFPSVTFPRVRGMFMSKPYLIPEQAATILAHICCSDKGLPQGAPTSPVVSNMLCAKMDNEIARLAAKHRCRYTRYADDMTFSTDAEPFPPEIADLGSSGAIQVGASLERVIANNGFQVNPQKTRLRRKDSPQIVTGLTVNNGPNVRRTYVRHIRAMLHAWERYGLAKADEVFRQQKDSKHRPPFKQKPKFEHVLRGKLAFLRMVVSDEDLTYKRYIRQFQRLILLDTFEQMAQMDDPRQRGYLLERLLTNLFRFSSINCKEPFRRNDGSEQIDGAFELDGSHYLVECKWHKSPSDHTHVDLLNAKIRRSGPTVRGLFISINGWTSNVPQLLKENPDKSTILMNGAELRFVLRNAHRIDLARIIRQKTESLHRECLPFLDSTSFNWD